MFHFNEKNNWQPSLSSKLVISMLNEGNNTDLFSVTFM